MKKIDITDKFKVYVGKHAWDKFEKEITQAVDRVNCMDKTDGFQNRYIDVVAAALSAGLVNPASNAQFDALVMLADMSCIAHDKQTENKNADTH